MTLGKGQINMLLAMRNTVWMLIVCHSHWVIISSMKRRFMVAEYTHALASISSIQLAFLFFFYFWIKPSTTQPQSNYGNSLIACRCPLGVSVKKTHDSAMMQTVLILANVNVCQGSHENADKNWCAKSFADDFTVYIFLPMWHTFVGNKRQV